MARPRGSRDATPPQRKFAELMITGDVNQSEAYMQAYPRSRNWKPAGVASKASDLMKNVHVQRIISEGRALALQVVCERVGIDRAEMIRRFESQLTVDRNEFTELRRVPCRHCFGRDHDYQETLPEQRMRRREWERQRKLALASAKHGQPLSAFAEFDEMGGVGYSRKREPNPNCPNCEGDGIEEVFIHDTRKLGKDARELFEGVSVKRDGIEVSVMSREKAQEGIARTLGMFVDKSVNLNLNAEDAKKAAEAMPDDPVDASKEYLRLMGGK